MAPHTPFDLRKLLLLLTSHLPEIILSVRGAVSSVDILTVSELEQNQ